MYRDIKIGIIGCGMVGDIHVKNLLKMIPASNIYLCDKSQEILQNVSMKYSIKNIYTDDIHLITNHYINSIIICSPPRTHFDLIVKCINADKNLLIEKPIATRIDDLNKIQQLVETKLELIVMDCSARHSVLQPKFDFIKSLISDKDFGELYYIHHNSVNRQKRPGVEYHPSAKWFIDKNISGGGPFIDWGVYDLAFHMGILNRRPELLNFRSYFYNGLDSISREKDFSVEEHAIAMMEFDNLNYYYERSTNAHNYSRNETRIYSSKMGLKFNYLFAEDNKVQIFRNSSDGVYSEEEVEVSAVNYNGYESDYFEMDKEFIKCLSKECKPKLKLFESLKNLDLLLNIYNKETIKF